MNRVTALAAALLLGLLAVTPCALGATYTFATIDYPSAVNTVAQGINNSGQVTGYCEDDTNTLHGFVESIGVLTYFDYTSATRTYATAINDSGQVTGYDYDSSGKAHGFVKSGDAFTQFDHPSTLTATLANGINNSGQITGYYTDNKGKDHGFVKTGGLFTRVDYPYASNTHVTGINNNGQVTGYYTDAKGAYHGFVKTGGVLTRVDHPSAVGTWVLGINDSSQVTGYYLDNTNVVHGFVKTGRVFTMIDFPSARDTYPNSINDSGQVTGYYRDGNGTQHGFVASPVIDSSTLLGPSNPASSILYDFCGGFWVNQEQWAGRVNCDTGNLSETVTDLSIAGRGRHLNLTRTYNSLDAASGNSGMFGRGWRSSYDKSLTFNQDNSVTVHQEGGATVTFTKTASGYTAPAYVTASLVKNNRAGTYTVTLKNQLIDTFDANGHLISQTDRNGLVTTLTYVNDRLNSVTDPWRRSLNFKYIYGHVTQVIDSHNPNPRTVSYAYDTSGNLTSVSDAGGGVTSYAYDANHLLTAVTDPLHGQVSNGYDSSARIVSQTNQLGKVAAFSYTTALGSNFTTLTDPNGNVSVRTFSNHLLTSITWGYGTQLVATWTYAYDTGLNRTQVIDANGNIWKAAYDAKGNRVKNSDPLGNTVTTTYNRRNDPVTITDADGATTFYTYEQHGNIASISRPLRETSQRATTSYVYYSDRRYFPPGVLETIIGPTGARTKYEYDYYTTIIDPDGGATNRKGDDLGRLASIVSPLGNTTSYSYNNFGDLTSITDPLGHTVTWAYDAKRQLTTFTDQDNRKTQHLYDAAGRLTKITRNDGTALLSAYDDAGNLVSQTDALGNTTTFAYDALNRLTGVTDPLNRTTSYTYDLEGNRTTRTDPDGHTVSLTHDAARRLTSESYNDGQTQDVSYAYDPVGRRTAMSDGSGKSTFQYDSLGRLVKNRLVKNVDGAGQSVSYGYDLRGLATVITYPNNRSVSRQYDPAGRLKSVTDWLGKTSRFEYDADGNHEQTIYPNGWTGQYTYDNADRLMDIKYSKMGVAGLEFGYTRTAAGLLLSETVNFSWLASYTYDAFGRLTHVAGLNPYTYTYDGADRIISATPAAGAGVQFTYDPADQLIDETISGSTFEFDQGGNRTGHALLTYTYDQANRLTAFGTSASYAYDGEGLRISKTVGTQTEHQYTWDRRARLPLILSTGASSYIYGAGSIPVEQVSDSGSVFFYHADQLGSIRMLTDSNGTQKASYNFDAYGNNAGGSQVQDDFGYAGAFTDAESGLLYMRARYYDPATAQFISRDPLFSETRHPYAYCKDSPVNFVDTTGLNSGNPNTLDPNVGDRSPISTGGQMDPIGMTTGGSGVVMSTQGAVSGVVVSSGYSGHMGPSGSSVPRSVTINGNSVAAVQPLMGFEPTVESAMAPPVPSKGR